MPRMGLTPDKVVAAAAQLADEIGLDALSLSKLAATLGVRVPSLYKHIGGLEDLRRRIGARAAIDLTTAVEGAAHGKAGQDALFAAAAAYRRYAAANYGSYQAFSLRSAGYAHRGTAVDTVLRRAAADYGLAPDDAKQAGYAIRAALHGFVVLEADGGFGTADTEAAFQSMMAFLARGLATAPITRPSGLDLPGLGMAGR